MLVRILLLSLSIFIVAANAGADEIKTTYALSSYQATVSTVVKKASAKHEELMRSFLFDKIADSLRSLPNVTSISYNNKVEEEEVSTASYYDYYEVKRKYPVIVQLSLPSSVTLMLKVEETYRKCKSPADKPKDSGGGGRGPGGGGSSSSSVGVDCVLGSSVTVRGPYAVYGNFASSNNVDNLLKEKQYLKFEVARDSSDKTSMKLDSRFYIDSDLFDKNLFRFLDAFNLTMAPPTKVDSMSGDAANSLFTRSNILLGIARILRVNNEKVVQL